MELVYIFLFFKASLPALETTRTPGQGVPRAVSPEEESPMHEANHSPASSD
jgi:hypothetical protein